MSPIYDNLDEVTRPYRLSGEEFDISRDGNYMNPHLNELGEQNYIPHS